MALIIPTIGSCGSKITAGEKRLARILESNLSHESLCWYDIPTGEKQTHPDFIILDPQKGLLFIEVKDWFITRIREANKTHITYETPEGIIPLTNPVEQARQYAYNTINALKQDSELTQTHERYKGHFCAPYGYGVYLSNITRKQFEKYISGNKSNDIFPADMVICKDDITEFMSREEVSSRIFKLLKNYFPPSISTQQVDRIRWHLYPEIRINNQHNNLQSERNENYSLITPSIIKIMDTQQELLARSLGEGHRVIHGVAGSGKTLILLYRCLHLAKNEELSKPILVVCYNIMLAKKLEALIKIHELPVPVEVIHFHAWCHKQAKDHNILPAAGKDFFQRLEQAVITGHANNVIKTEQYSAVLIDEGHDFEQEWLKLLSKMVDSSTDSLLFLYDDAQSIYKKKSSLDFTLASVDIKAQGRTTIFNINYRNTQQILHFATNIAFDYLNDHIDEKLRYQKPDAGGLYGQYPTVLEFSDHDKEISHIVDWLSKEHNKGISWQNIAILCPSTSILPDSLVRQLVDKNIPCTFISKPQDKKYYTPQTDAVAIIPLPSSKGLEFHSVAVIDCSYVRKETDDLSDDIKRLYVGFTRATNNLLVTMHRKNTLSQHISSIYQRISAEV